jgi:tetratricopeptide (TPR) repeat protein
VLGLEPQDFQGLFTRAEALSGLNREAEAVAAYHALRQNHPNQLVKQLAEPQIRSTAAFDNAHPGMQQFVSNWCSDLEMELGNAGLDDPVYHEHRIHYTREFLSQFPDEEANTYVNFMRAQGEAQWYLGRRDKADATYAALIERYPDAGWATIG